MNRTNYEVYPKQFRYATNISWLEVERQVELEKSRGTAQYVSDETDLCIDCGCEPGVLSNIYERFLRDTGWKAMHMYTSKKVAADGLGRHNDDQEVLIVQSRGRMKYQFDDGNTVLLYPGDGLYIPIWMYHNPITIEPRITLSFSPL